MIWPDWYTKTIAEVVVAENLASIVHILAASAFALLSCHRRVFWAYLAYQLVTTAGKTLAFPEHTLSDWSWDLVGDTMEYLTGVGIIEVLGLTGKTRLPPPADKACSPRAILAATIALLALWALLLARSF